MRILTVRQPWAWAIIHGGKDVENRVRNLAGKWRGSVAIHVAGKYATEGLDLPALDDACDAWCAEHGCGRQHPWQANVGHIIGVVDLVDVHQGTVTKGSRAERVASCFRPGKPFGLCSPWAEDDAWHMELANPRPLSEPIPYKGALGLRRFNETVDAEILKALEALS